MIVARITKDKYAAMLDGKGAELYGARWNSPGQPVVYTSSCGALAALEYRVHVGEIIPTRLKLLWIEIPDTLKSEEIAIIPIDAKTFQQVGDEWIERGEKPLLIVPSVVVPKQKNILINPRHALAGAIQIKQETPFVMDTRLLSAIR